LNSESIGATHQVAGKHVVITGGGRGIGRAIAGHLHELGARITLMGRDEGMLAAYRRGGRRLCIPILAKQVLTDAASTTRKRQRRG
jgi:NAD(P)-dependent dehydrogenase (short-subunit alcohol dehydrogenase family)